MNEKLRKALFSGEYHCYECGKLMVFEDETCYTLVCEHCGWSCALEDYGLNEDEMFYRHYESTGVVEPEDDFYDSDD